MQCLFCIWLFVLGLQWDQQRRELSVFCLLGLGAAHELKFCSSAPITLDAVVRIALWAGSGSPAKLHPWVCSPGLNTA